MLDRADAEAVIYRVAISAFTYYPAKAQDEPGYTIDEDVTWCLQPLRGLEPDQLYVFRARITTLIADPTADRRAFIADLHALTET